MERTNKHKKCYGIFSVKTGRLVLIQGELPIYWSRKVATERTIGFPETKVKRTNLEQIEKIFK